MTDPAGRGAASILDPSRAGEHLRIGRRHPPPALAAYVEYFWWVRWRARPAYSSRLLPAPVVHLSAEWYAGRPRLLVTGVQRTRFDRELVGEGHVAAAAFRPGCFRPLLRDRVSTLTDRIVPAHDVLGVDDRLVAARLLEPGTVDDDLVGLLADWLESLHSEPDPRAEDIAALVAVAESDPALVRAEQLAATAGVSLRTLQRQFSAYVGIGPKWVVQRCRLLDVSRAAHTEQQVDWAALADRLGFADQSHLIRAFTAVVGRSPAAYAKQASGGSPS